MANNNYYLGVDPQSRLGDTPRYFYALRRNSNGSLYFVRIDNMKDSEAVDINNPGDASENYTDFEVGVDFFEGINVNHQEEFGNLKYPQYRWDDRAIFYYINSNGELVAKINQGHTYTAGTSE